MSHGFCCDAGPLCLFRSCSLAGLQAQTTDKGLHALVSAGCDEMLTDLPLHCERPCVVFSFRFEDLSGGDKRHSFFLSSIVPPCKHTDIGHGVTDWELRVLASAGCGLNRETLDLSRASPSNFFALLSLLVSHHYSNAGNKSISSNNSPQRWVSPWLATK